MICRIFPNVLGNLFKLTFMELMYYAGKGRTTPAEMERKLAQDLEKKGNLTTPMSNSKRTSDTGTKTYSSTKEGRLAAMEDQGLL